MKNFCSLCERHRTLRQYRRYELSFNKWPKRSAEKNYFMVPNEIFSIGLDFREISIYSYLLRCENRKTYQCYPSYKTIGHAIGMSENTVAKYVRQLEEKGLIYTEPTIMQSKDGKPPERESALHHSFLSRVYSKRSMSGSSGRQRRLPLAIVRRSSSKKSNAQGRQNALLCAFPRRAESQSQPED